MNRIISLVVVLLIAISLFGTDRFSREPMFIATTGRIIKINAQARTMIIRGSEGLAVRNLSETEETSSHAIGVKLPGIIVPGGITITLPGRTGKPPQSKSTSEAASRDEYTVVTSRDTVFQDGGDSIRFDDFKDNDTISIHGLLKGTILTASRVAKWD